MFAIFISMLEMIFYLILPFSLVLILSTRQFYSNQKIGFLIFILASGILGSVNFFSTLFFKEMAYWIPLVQAPLFHPSSSSTVEIGKWYELTEDALFFVAVRAQNDSLEDAYRGYKQCSFLDEKGYGKLGNEFFDSCWVQRCSEAEHSFSVVRKFAKHYCSELSEEEKKEVYLMYQVHYPLPCDYCDCVWPDFIEPLENKSVSKSQ
ncbi:MAG: hypothetical protein CMK59_07560 [Proteobacteria bacterium]|nr:hypothetical protein [Pseudomonadota bacterium]